MSSSLLLSNCLESAECRAEFLSELRQRMPQQRWFAGKAKQIASVELVDVIDLPADPICCGLVVLDVTFADRSRDEYVLPVSIPSPGAVPREDSSARVWRLLLQTAFSSHSGRLGRSLRGVATPALDRTGIAALTDDMITVHSGQQSNTSVAVGESYFLKLFRRPQPGINPDAEVGIFLTGRFGNSPAVAGTIEYVAPSGEVRCIAILSERVTAECDAWSFCLKRLGQFWEHIKARPQVSELKPPIVDWRLNATSRAIPSLANELIGDFLADASCLGRRTGELHVALNSDSSDPAFAAERLTGLSLVTLLNGIRHEIHATESLLRDRKDVLAALGASKFAAQFSGRAADLLQSLSHGAVPDIDLIRVHGDYHLGQVLRTSNDFQIIDFEGEPDRPLAERRQKRPAIKDVAGMVRSFHYASNAGAVGLIDALRGLPASVDVAAWQQFWFACTSRCYLNAYADAVRGTRLLPHDPQEAQRLLDVFLLEKAMYELRYELNNRPDWARIPLIGLAAAIGAGSLE